MQDEYLKQQFENLRSEISGKIDNLDGRLTATATQASVTHAQVLAHIAVCDERHKQTDKRQEDRRQA